MEANKVLIKLLQHHKSTDSPSEVIRVNKTVLGDVVLIKKDIVRFDIECVAIV